MKRQIKIISLFITITLFMSSCMPVRDALKNNNRSNYSHNKKPKTEDNSLPSSVTTNKTDAIYQQSKDYLINRSSTLTDYCISWIGVPHQLGGNSRKGVDCSGFVYNVYKDVYDIILPRRSADMEKEVDILTNRNKLKEGDLIFFGKGRINHVGIFLNKDNFIHTSTSKGVIVSSLEEKYWKENFYSCGHHPQVEN